MEHSSHHPRLVLSLAVIEKAVEAAKALRAELFTHSNEERVALEGAALPCEEEPSE